MEKKKIKKYWFGTIFGRDYFIAEAESKKHLIKSLIDDHNVLVWAGEMEYEPKCREAKSIKGTTYVYLGAFSKEDYKNHTNSNVMFNAWNNLEKYLKKEGKRL